MPTTISSPVLAGPAPVRPSSAQRTTTLSVHVRDANGRARDHIHVHADFGWLGPLLFEVTDANGWASFEVEENYAWVHLTVDGRDEGRRDLEPDSAFLLVVSTPKKSGWSRAATLGSRGCIVHGRSGY